MVVAPTREFYSVNADARTVADVDDATVAHTATVKANRRRRGQTAAMGVTGAESTTFTITTMKEATVDETTTAAIRDAIVCLPVRPTRIPVARTVQQTTTNMLCSTPVTLVAC